MGTGEYPHSFGQEMDRCNLASATSLRVFALRGAIEGAEIDHSGRVVVHTRAEATSRTDRGVNRPHAWSVRG